MNYQHDPKQFSDDLLSWFTENARILPWRSEPTPYRVWVSEIMLQQTRVEAVKPYFERFIRELPDIEALAYAEDDKLAKLWEGLGYYHRVRNMKKCALQCMKDHHGQLPKTYEQLCQLPGIGSYTAGAIASIAFGECVPAVDGNVLRVFSRILVDEDDILKEATKKKYQKIIKEYIPEGESSAFNQALMEIGALVCVPNSVPRCNICPLAKNCIGYQSGEAQRLPNKSAKKKRRQEKKTVLVFYHNGKVLLRKRKEEGLLPGLYEFVSEEGYLSKQELHKRYPHAVIYTLHDAKHVFSHIEWHMHGFLIVCDQAIDMEGIWCSIEQLKREYALPTAWKVYKDAVLQYERGIL